MAFMQLIMTASKLQKLKNELIEEKADAINISKEPSKKKRRHYTAKLRMKVKNFFKKVLSCFCFHKFCFTVRHDGSCENYTLKSIVGFVSGFILTYIFFMFSVFQLNFSLPTATVFCSILGCVLMIGLAFSTKVRCVVLLTLPQFFSQKGRQALMAYAFILAISGPARNALNNMGILSESLACGQEQLKQAVGQIIEVIKKPFLALKEAIKKVVKTVKEVVLKIKEILLKIKRIIMAILKVIKAAFQFLAKIINICNKELGTPFERCTRVFENAIADCNAKLGPLFSWLCSLAYIVQSVCYLVKFLDLICMIMDFISDSIVGVVIRKVKTFIRHIRTMFYVRIKFSHSFEFHRNSSKTMAEIAHAMTAEVRQRTETIRAIFKFMTSAATLFFLFMIIKVTYYRFKFLTSERFDNKYINKDFREIDMRRAKLGKETVLPLNDREMQVYVTVSSKKLAKSEKSALAKAASSLATASVKLAIFMATDYSLFWILNLIQYYGKFQSKVQAPNIPTIHVSGNGFLADLLKSIVMAFQPLGIKLEIDTVPCLPTPIPPNYDRYVQIATIIILCWVLTLLEPYGLRLRHIVMCYYHPVRAKQRAIWLYNHIMRSRNSFLKFARRQLRRKILGDGTIAKVTCKEHLAANVKVCRLCFGENLQQCCMLCGEVFRESDNKKPIKCQTPDCPGVYCEQCFSDLQNLCTICLSPIEYGDLSDISEEKDSSEEEPKTLTPKDTKKSIWRKWFACCKCCKKCCPEEETKDETKKRTPRPRKKYDADKDSSDEESKLVKDESHQIVTDKKDDEHDKTKDSDYYSSDDSTDYSYSYQYDKGQDAQPIPIATSFKDIEKQELPDYASMTSFREDANEVELQEKIMLDKETTTVSKRSAGTIISGTTFEEIRKGRKVEFTGVPDKSKTTKRKKKKRKRPRMQEERPLLDDGSCSCTCSDTDDTGRLQHLQSPVLEVLNSSSSSITVKKDLPYMSSSDESEKPPSISGVKSKVRHVMEVPRLDIYNTQNIRLPRRDLSSSSLDSEIQCKHEYVKMMVPELDLSSLSSTPRSNKIYVSDKFGNVKYEEVSESPKSTSSSNRQHSSSTEILSVNRILTKSRSKVDKEIQTNAKAKVDVGLSAKPVDRYKFEEKQRKKVKQYYKAVKDIPTSRTEEKRKSGKFMKFVQKIIPKRKRNSDFLPLYSKSNREYIELNQTRHYHQHPWDTPSSTTLNSAVARQRSATNPDYYISSEEEEDRVRGGASGHIVNFHQPPNRCNNSQETSFSRTERSESRIIRKEVLARYFVSIEDLTPTRDCDVPMTSLDTAKPRGSRQDQVLIRELPEKDTTLTVDAKRTHSSAVLLPASIHTVHASSSSNLSEGFCTSVLGVPCSIAEFRSNSKTSRTSSTHSKDFPVKRESLSVTPEAEFKANSKTSRTSSIHSKDFAVKRESLSVIPEVEAVEEGTPEEITAPGSKELRDSSKRESIQSQQDLTIRKNTSVVSEACSCESIVHKDEVSQTSPSSILKHCRLQSVTTIKSISNTDQPSQNILAETGINTEAIRVPSNLIQQSYKTLVETETNTETLKAASNLGHQTGSMERTASRTDKTVETTEKCPVRESSTNARTALTSDKTQQTSNNSIYSISKAPVFLESSEATQCSHSSTSYCGCSYEMSQPLCGYGCCRCPPPPPKFENFPSPRDVEYGAGPRRSCPGYIEKYPKYIPDVPSEYSIRSASKPPSLPRRNYMELPSNSGYSLRESKYRDLPQSFTSNSSRSRSERPRSRHKPPEGIILCSCNGDCVCCVSKRKPPQPPMPPQYRQLSYESSTSSEAEDEDDNEEEENSYYYEPHSNRHDLPYQNSDDYMDLVQELEETLQSRNRNRVRRAMHEFERRSRYNKPLEKPIIDYDQASESEEPIIQKISQLTSEKKRCCGGDNCTCRRDTRPRSSMDKRPQPKPRTKTRAVAGRMPQTSQSEESKTRWQMDTNSGEWYKVSDQGKQQRFKGRRRSVTPSPRRPCTQGCSCCASKGYDFR